MLPDRRGLKKRICTQALRHNWQQIRRRSTARQLLAVVKSNAYGHGLHAVAPTLAPLADGFAVVLLQDALELRQQGISAPIVLLQGIFAAEEVVHLAEHKLTPVVHSGWQVQALAQLPASARLTAYVKVNSGMNRLGFALDEAKAALDAVRQLPAVREVVLMTHFADADRADGIAAALDAIAPLRTPGQLVSLGNSAATLLHSDIADDYARMGIALYGASPAPQWRDHRALNLLPVMTYSCKLIAVREVARGAGIGYGAEYTAAHAMKVGIASVGYGDGYPRRNGLMASVQGAAAPLLGRVSMEMIALDLTACPNAAAGDEVVLWGDAPQVDEVAAAADTIAYHLLTSARGEIEVQ